MLTLLLIKLLFGGGSIELLTYIGNVEGSVKMVVAKGASQNEALKTLKAMKKIVEARNKQEGRMGKDLAQAFQDYQENTATIDAIWVSYFEENEIYNANMLDLRFELREHISREEWGLMFPADEVYQAPFPLTDNSLPEIRDHSLR